MNTRAVGSGIAALIAAAVGSTVAKRLHRRYLDSFGSTFDKAYSRACDIAEQNWEDIEKLMALDINGPIKPKDLDRIMMLKASYLWYYSEHATRGVMLKYEAMSLPISLRLQGRNACMRSLLRFHRESHEQLLKVRNDFRSLGVPSYYLHIPARNLMVTNV